MGWSYTRSVAGIPPKVNREANRGQVIAQQNLLDRALDPDAGMRIAGKVAMAGASPVAFTSIPGVGKSVVETELDFFTRARPDRRRIWFSKDGVRAAAYITAVRSVLRETPQQA